MNTRIRGSASQPYKSLATTLSRYAQEPEWVVDPISGDDRATGRPGAPLRTSAELGFRLSGQVLAPEGGLMTCTWLSEADPFIVRGSALQDGSELELVGTPSSVQAGSITAAVLGGTGQWTLTTTGPDWTTTAERRIVLQGGQVLWVGEVLGANSVRASTAEGEIAQDAFTIVAPVAFTVDAPCRMPLMRTDIMAGDNPPVFTPGQVSPIRSRAFDLWGGGQQTSQFSVMQLFGCAVRNSRTFSDTLYLRSCLRDVGQGIDFAARDDAYILVADGGLWNDSADFFNVWLPGGQATWLRYGQWFRNATLFLNSPTFFQNITGSRMHFEDFEDAAVNVFSPVAAQFFGAVSGSSARAGSYGINVNAGMTASYGIKPTVAGVGGSTVAVRLGGTVFDYAAIPGFNAANFAKLVAA